MNEFVIKNGFISQGTSYVSDGNLGVGVTSPTSRLEVKGIDSSSSNFGLKVQNSGGTDNLVVRNNGKFESNISTDSNSWDFTNTVGTAIFKIDSVDYSIIQLYTAGVQRYFLQAGSGTNFLRLLSPSFEVRSNSNNVIQMFDAVNETVGIGTSTPTAKLEVKSNSSTGNTMYPFSVTNYPGSNVFYLSNQNYYVNPNNLGVYSYIYDNQFNIELAGSSGQFKLNRGVNKFWMNPYPNDLGINLLVESSIGGGGGAEAGIRHVFTSTSGGGTIYGESLYVGTDSSTGTTTIVGNFIGKQGFTNPNATFYPLIALDGNVGIGTSTPSEKLEVVGKTKTTNFQMTSGGTEDYILTSSDSQGNGKWTPSYNLSTKDYGSFYDTTTQTGGNGTIQSFQLNSSGATKGISITDLTGITVTHTGVYNIQFSAQIASSVGTPEIVFIWLRKNGIDLPNSNTGVEIGNNNDYYVAAWNFVEQFNSNDIINLMWYSPSTNISIVYNATPTAGPEIPSLILTITQI